MTGNPVVEIYNGIKLAAGGELGIGVGEEEWGSGEREVLEDFVARTDGLVDLVVSRFGDPSRQASDSPPVPKNDEIQWLGSDTDPRPADGIIFSGTGAVSRPSLTHVSHWMEWIFRYGDTAYGIGRDPNSLHRRRPRRQRRQELLGAQPSTPELGHTPGIPRPLVMAEPQAIPRTHENTPERSGTSLPEGDLKTDKSAFPTDTVMKYLTLGYGSAWSFSAKSASASPVGSPGAVNEPTADAAGQNEPSTAQSPPPDEPRLGDQRNESKNSILGRFVLGPRDDLDTLDDLEERSPEPEVDAGRSKSRIIHRSLHVRLTDAEEITPLQAVIYVVGSR